MIKLLLKVACVIAIFILDNKFTYSQEQDSIYTLVEEMPSFPGGEKKLKKFINKNIKCPPSKKKLRIEGTVYTSFLISKDGRIRDAEIIRGIPTHPEFDKEVIKVIKKMPKWNPGKQNGKEVTVKFNLPITFNLNLE